MDLQAEFRSGLLFSPIAWRSWRLSGSITRNQPPRRQGRQGRLYGVESSVWLQSVKSIEVRDAGLKSGATVPVVIDVWFSHARMLPCARGRMQLARIGDVETSCIPSIMRWMVYTTAHFTFPMPGKLKHDSRKAEP